MVHKLCPVRKFTSTYCSVEVILRYYDRNIRFGYHKTGSLNGHSYLAIIICTHLMFQKMLGARHRWNTNRMYTDIFFFLKLFLLLNLSFIQVKM